MLKIILSLVAATLAAGCYVPYANDILKHRVQPSRSARIMFASLLIITIFQQSQLKSGWLMAITIGEWIGSIGILALAIKRGIGGFSRIDKICYLLLIIDVVIWQTTGNVLLSLYLTVSADFIAFIPTLVKSYKHPWSETPLFFILGGLAPLINIVGDGKYQYSILLFPVYLALVNFLETALVLYGQSRITRPAGLHATDNKPIN